MSLALYENDIKRYQKQKEKCYRHLTNLKGAEDLEDFQDSWDLFVVALDNYCAGIFKAYNDKSDGFNKWKAPYITVFKSDDLLQYFKKMRDSIAHDNVEHNLDSNVNFLLTEKSGQGFNGGEIETSFIDGVLSINYIKDDLLEDFDLGLKVSREQPDVKSTIDRNKKVYIPPKKHKGKKLLTKKAIPLGEMVLAFYETIEASAESHFSNNEAS
jgi:hypothetical protein